MNNLGAPAKLSKVPRNALFALMATGVAVHVLGFSLFQVRPDDPADVPEERPFIRLSAGDSGASTPWPNKALLRDYEPIFLPTRWNAQPLASRRLDAEQAPEAFPPFQKPLRANEFLVAPPAASEELPSDAPFDVLARTPPRPWETFGMAPAETKPAPSGAMRVINIATGTEQRIPLDLPAMAEPAELWLVIGKYGDATQALPAPALSEAVRAAVRQALPHATLGPGYYRIEVGN